MPFDVDIEIANPNPDENPQTWQQAVENLRTLFTATVAGAFAPSILGSDTPAVEDQDKVWYKLDISGRPLGTFIFYNGHWRRTQMGLATEYRYFSGNPATYFDNNGKGKVDTDWDGWQLANGQNGTANLSDKFIAIGKIDDSSGFNEGTGLWETHASGVNHTTGGAASFSLTQALTPRPARPNITVGKMTADGLGPSGSGTLYGSNLGTPVVLQVDEDGVAGPTTIPTLPPYYALALAKWIGFT